MLGNLHVKAINTLVFRAYTGTEDNLRICSKDSWARIDLTYGAEREFGCYWRDECIHRHPNYIDSPREPRTSGFD